MVGLVSCGVVSLVTSSWNTSGGMEQRGEGVGIVKMGTVPIYLFVEENS